MSQNGPSLSEIGRALLTSPAVTRLGQEVGRYAVARATALVDDLTERLDESGDGGGLTAAFAGARGPADGRPAVRAGIGAAMTRLKETVGSTLHSGRGAATAKATVICEDIDIGLEYHPQGPVERTGNLWRAGGRRVRLDLKHFRRFVMLNGEATGSWRAEIRDGTVVRQPQEAEREDLARPAADDEDLEYDGEYEDGEHP